MVSSTAIAVPSHRDSLGLKAFLDWPDTYQYMQHRCKTFRRAPVSSMLSFHFDQCAPLIVGIEESYSGCGKDASLVDRDLHNRKGKTINSSIAKRQREVPSGSMKRYQVGT